MALPELNVPAWLNSGEPAGLPMLRGVQAGSQIASNFMQARAMKERAAERQKEFSLRERELTSRTSAMAIEQQLHTQQLAAAKIQAMDLAAVRERTNTAQGMLAQAGDLVGKAIIAPVDNPAARTAVYDVFARYPGLVSIPQGKALWETFQTSEQNAGDLQRQIAVAKARPGLVTDTPAIRNAAYLAKLRQDAEAARASGDTKLFQQKQSEITDIQEQIQKGQSFTVYDPATGAPIAQMNSGGAPSGSVAPTVALRSAAQQKLVKYENSSALIGDLQRNLTSDQVGVKGVLGESIVDKGLAQFFPELADKDRIDNRAKLQMAREGLMREISDDPRFNMQDRAEIGKALPSSGVFESYDDAMQKFATVQKVIKDRSRTYAKSIGAPIPDFTKTEQELINEFSERVSAIQEKLDSKVVNNEQAMAEYNRAKAEHQLLLDKWYPLKPSAGQP